MTLGRSALDRLHDHAVHADMCFVCGISFAASPVNCNVHAFSAGEGGEGAGAFVMMNSSKKHDSVQVWNAAACLRLILLVEMPFAGPKLFNDRDTHVATISCARITF